MPRVDKADARVEPDLHLWIGFLELGQAPDQPPGGEDRRDRDGQNLVAVIPGKGYRLRKLRE